MTCDFRYLKNRHYSCSQVLYRKQEVWLLTWRATTGHFEASITLYAYLMFKQFKRHNGYRSLVHGQFWWGPEEASQAEPESASFSGRVKKALGVLLEGNVNAALSSYLKVPWKVVVHSTYIIYVVNHGQMKSTVERYNVRFNFYLCKLYVLYYIY